MICPKCGTEFVEGVTHCSDCKVPLVAPSELKKKTEFFMTAPTDVAKKFIDFLVYSGIYAEVQESDTEDVSLIYVELGRENRAKKLATVFLDEEAKNMPLSESEETTDILENNNEDNETSTYILAKDKHAESNSTFWMLAAAAIIVIGVSVKNTITGFSAIIDGTYSSYLPFIVFWFIGLLLVWGSVKYYKITKEFKNKISAEELWHTQVSYWLEQTFTANSIDEYVTATYGDAQEEIFILNRYDYLKKEARNKFSDIPTGFLDLEIETFYEKIFE